MDIDTKPDFTERVHDPAIVPGFAFSGACLFYERLEMPACIAGSFII
ncbi:MAG: hypothetical protein RIB30_21225 [Thalassospira sp.]